MNRNKFSYDFKQNYDESFDERISGLHKHDFKAFMTKWSIFFV